MRRALHLAVMTVLVAACGSSDEGAVPVGADTSEPPVASGPASHDSRPQDAKFFTYEVAYGEPSISGEAQVTYTNSGGDEVVASVTMPWASEPIAVREGQSYRIEASAAPRDDATLNCGVNTDNGWYLGNSEPIGECSYTFPDDLEDDES